MNLHDIQFTYRVLYSQYANIDAETYDLCYEIYRTIWIEFLDMLREHFKDLSLVRDNKIYKCIDIVSHSGKLRLELCVDGVWIGVNLLDLKENELK